MNSLSKKLLRALHRAALACSILILASPPGPAQAQETTPAPPVYIAQAGDTLSSIALQFGVPLSELVAFNNLSDANQLFIGDRIAIPGLEGITGILTTITVPLGESMRSLQRQYRIPTEIFQRLNHVVSPGELYKGAPLVIPVHEGAAAIGRVSLQRGESLLELAVRHNANPWAIAEQNHLNHPASAAAPDILFLEGQGTPGPGGLPPAIEEIQINLLFQGEAALIHLRSSGELSVTGSLGDYVFPFHRQDGEYFALQGLHALLDPGLYPLELTATDPEGQVYAFSQLVKVNAQDYIFEYIAVDPVFLDPATTEAEFDTIQPYLLQSSETRYWDGKFTAPSPNGDCINSTYGNRRSFNGSAFTYYHSGVDFCGGEGTKIFAPAPGMVVYAGNLEIRGNFTIIDHGWGVLTAYMHQSEILVSVGDVVAPGDVIGLVGNTGRSTGAHLHWELWINGVAVNPLDWLASKFP